MSNISKYVYANDLLTAFAIELCEMPEMPENNQKFLKELHQYYLNRINADRITGAVDAPVADALTNN